MAEGVPGKRYRRARNGRRILTELEREQITVEVTRGGETLRAVGKRWGLHKDSVFRIKRRCQSKMAASGRNRMGYKKVALDPDRFLHFFRTVSGFDPTPFQERWAAKLCAFRRLIILAPPEFAKTTFFVYYTLWRLGLDPDLRSVWLGTCGEQVAKPVGQIRQRLLLDEALHEFFPKLKPAGGVQRKWKELALNVERERLTGDYSLLAQGHRGPLPGSRSDLIIWDDLLDFVLTLTKHMRDKTEHWFKMQVLSRLVADGQIVIANQIWHPLDLTSHLVKSGQYEVDTTTVCEEYTPGKAINPAWIEMFPPERIHDIYNTLANPAMFFQLYFHRPAAMGETLIPSESISLARTLGQTIAIDWQPGFLIVVGGDLAIGSRTSRVGSETVLVVVFHRPDGLFQVQEVRAGLWSAKRILDEIDNASARYGYCEVAVESNQAQAYIAEFAEDRVAKVKKQYTTWHNKHDPVVGIPGLCSEFERGRWVVPPMPESENLLDELASIRRGESKVGDRAMALWHARERLRERGKQAVTVEAPRKTPADTGSASHNHRQRVERVHERIASRARRPLLRDIRLRAEMMGR